MPAPLLDQTARPAKTLLFICAMLLAFACGCGDDPQVAPAAQNNDSTAFPTPEAAVDALAAATKERDAAKLLAIFGPEAKGLATSGDPGVDRRNREVFLVALEQRRELQEVDRNTRELVIGNEQWPFPVPIVRESNGWRFDTEAGKREVLARRIGRNELAAIGISRTYVTAQQQYAAQPRDAKPAGIYAQKVRSTPGKHDGLFWPAAPGEKSSPLGDLAAQAESEGYAPTTNPTQGPRPLRGYLFRILTQQGPAAPGGAKSYLVNNELTAGFALIAYPADYGNSGIMTFIVNQDGIVHEADLGPETPKLAAAINAYDPDERFRPVD